MISESDNTVEGSYVKDKLDNALRKKVDEIDEKRIAEELEKAKFEKMTKKQKEQHKLKQRGKIEYKKKKTLCQEERDIHEAYQLLLAEHHKRVKQRVKQKISTVAALMKKPTEPSNNGDKSIHIDEKLGSWKRSTNPNRSNDKEGSYDEKSFLIHLFT